MPINLPLGCNDFAMLNPLIETWSELTGKLPLTGDDRTRLHALYKTVSEQVRCGAVKPENAPQVLIEALSGDDVLGWLAYTATGVKAVAKDHVGQPLWFTPPSSWKMTSLEAGLCGTIKANTLLMPETQPEQSDTFQSDYAFQVMALRNAFTQELVEAVCNKVTPQGGTTEEMAHGSKARITRDAEALARIVADGYRVVRPSSPVDASTLVDRLKVDLAASLDSCVGMLLRSMPKTVETAPAVTKPSFPTNALSKRHASDRPRDAIRWLV